MLALHNLALSTVDGHNPGQPHRKLPPHQFDWEHIIRRAHWDPRQKRTLPGTAATQQEHIKDARRDINNQSACAVAKPSLVVDVPQQSHDSSAAKSQRSRWQAR